MSIEAKLSRLSLDLRNSQSPSGANTTLNGGKDETPDSWDDAADDDEPVEAPGPSLKQIISTDSPAPPPPTPISPEGTDFAARRWEMSGAQAVGSTTPRYAASGQASNDRRPEKTTSTANRMIAGALGIKAPKKTEEQRKYDRAVKEAEIKRKKKEKEQHEQQMRQDEEAKAAVWDD